MGLIKFIKSTFGMAEKYANHPEAIVITCFFNPMHSPYRVKAFNQFYNSIKHLNYHVIECLIGEDDAQLPQGVNNPNFSQIRSDSVLWHKEALLNKVVRELPKKYKYVFWIDADVLFINTNWLVDSVNKLKGGANILQPFEYCIHLDQDETQPSFDVDDYRDTVSDPKNRQKQMWRSFSANYYDDAHPYSPKSKQRAAWTGLKDLSASPNYDQHGHVGFAWGARREILDKVPLYDKALIGGADHIIAHAAAGQVPHSCITNAFRDDLENVLHWSADFAAVVKGKLSYADGDLYHIWHGDIDKRQYLKRVKDFTVQTKHISEKDANGLYVAKKGQDAYVKKYLQHREVSPTPITPYTPTPTTRNESHDDGFLQSMALGYMTDSPWLGGIMGGNFIGGLIGSELRGSQDNTVDTTVFEHHNHNIDVQQTPSDNNGVNTTQPDNAPLMFTVPEHGTNSMPDVNTNSVPDASNNNQDNGNFS